MCGLVCFEDLCIYIHIFMKTYVCFIVCWKISGLSIEVSITSCRIADRRDAVITRR